jgi:lipopolysaccharide transport system permease protein
MPSDGVPYPLLVFGGMLPWQFFANALSSSGQSLVNNANLVSKVYFPRLIIPASTIGTSLVDFLVSFSLMVIMMFCYHSAPSWRIILLPVFALLAFATALGPGLLVTAMNVKYRDFRYLLPFIVQFGAYVSPVGFSSARAFGTSCRTPSSLRSKRSIEKFREILSPIVIETQKKTFGR